MRQNGPLDMATKVKRKTRTGGATPKVGPFTRAYRWFVAADRKVKAVLGLGLIGIASGTVTYAPGAWRWLDKTLFRYPIEFRYVNQGETKTGYVFELQVRSTDGSTVFIPRNDLQARIVKDERLVDAMSVEDRKGLLYGEGIKVFDNAVTLDAEIEGRTYTKDPTIACTAKPRPLFLLLPVAGPGSTNPSSRLQIASVYRSLAVGVRRWLHVSDYVEIPIKHVSIVAGNDKIRIIQK